MNPNQAAGERQREVRVAARDWEKAGWIDAAKRAEIDRLFADDRLRLHWALRALAWIFSVLALTSAFGMFLGLTEHGLFGNNHFDLPAFLYGVVLLVVADLSHAQLKASGIGADDALEHCALGFILVGLVVLLDLEHSVGLGFLIAAGLFATAGWRWGGWLYGGLSVLSALAAAQQAPLSRACIALMAAILFAVLIWLERRPSLAPSVRQAVSAGWVIALAGFYVALHYGSVDAGMFERRLFGYAEPETAASFWFPAALLVTVLLPPLALLLAVRWRHRLLLLCGVALAVASLVTLRWYVHLAPLWVVLTGSGLALGGLALVLRRWLDSGSGHERGGFTSEPLLGGDRQRLMEVVAVLAVSSPAARPVESGPSGFAGGGGDGGGGGATTSF